MTGSTACMAMIASTTVCPSGAALATVSAAIMPEAPVRFSTITRWPRIGAR